MPTSPKHKVPNLKLRKFQTLLRHLHASRLLQSSNSFNLRASFSQSQNQFNNSMMSLVFSRPHRSVLLCL